MRIPIWPKSGAAPAKAVAVVAILALVAGTVIFMVKRRSPEPVLPKALPGWVELSRTNLVLERGRLRPTGSTNPFTGIMLEHYADGLLRSRSSVSNGLLNGLSQGWYTNGQMQVSEHFKHGISDGLRTKWYADGSKQSEAAIVAGKLNGPFQRWHTNGVLSERVEFIDDKPVGTSTSWFPSGYLKARVVLKDGAPAEQTFWKDGEKKE